MKSQFDLYDVLGIIAMIATPMAAALVFGWELYLYFLSITVPVVLAVAGAIAGAVAMESVGVYAGHVGIDYARRRDIRGLVAAAAMVFYIWFGWSKAPTYGAVFVLAGFVYALVALRHEAKGIDQQTAVTEKEDRNWEKRLQMEKLRMAHDEKLARIEAAKVGAKTPPTSPQVAAQLPASGRSVIAQFPSDFRLLTTEQKDAISTMTTREIVNAADIGESSARRWKREISANGYHK